MNQIITSATLILLYNIIFINLAFVLGVLFFSFYYRSFNLESKDYFDLAKFTFSGVLVIVALVSLTLTKGISISILFILLLFFALKIKKSIINSVVEINTQRSISFFRSLIILSVLTLFYTLFCFFSNYYFDLNRSYTAFPDFYYYIFNGDKMVSTGVEGIDFNLDLNSAANYRTPYHYSDLWLLGFFSITNYARIPLIHIYLFVFTPIVLVISSLSLYSIYSFFRKEKKWWDFLLGFFLVFYIFPFQSAWFSSQNIITMPKLYAPLIVLCISFGYFLRKEKMKALTVLFILPILNVIALPVLLFFCILLICYWVYRKDSLSSKFVSLLSLFYIIFFGGFYKVFGIAGKKMDLNDLNPELYIKSFFKACFKGTFQMFFMLSTCFLILFIYRKQILPLLRKHSFAFAVLIALIISSYLSSFILWFNFDAFQIRNFPGTMVSVILFIAFVAIVLNNLKTEMISSKIVLFTVVSFFIFSMWNSLQVMRTAADGFVSKSFVNKINENIKNNDRFGYIYNTTKEKVSPWVYTHNLLLYNLHFTGLTNKKLNRVSLNTIINDVDIDKQKLVKRSFIKQSEFKKFVDSLQLKKMTLEDYQIEFCLSRKLNFLVLEKQAQVSLKFNPYIRNEIVDSLSGNKVIFLKY